MAKMDKAIFSACGEHFVASYLSGLGLVVALTRARTPATDLIVTSEKGGKSVSLQVKTGGIYSHEIRKKKPEESSWVWRAGTKAMDRPDDAHWFAFVFVGEWPLRGDSPKVFFVPSKYVAKVLREQAEGQKEWFWMTEETGEQYCGLRGCEKIKKVIK